MSRPDPAAPGRAFWGESATQAFATVQSAPDGLTGAEAARRLAALGRNPPASGRRLAAARELLAQFTSPLILILIAATVVSGLLGDGLDAAIILAIIVASGLLGYWQERGAHRAVQALRSAVETTAEVLRDGAVTAVPLARVVPGDVVLLDAGDLVPGDGIVLEANALLVDESVLTGESFPVEKAPGISPGDAPVTARPNGLFLGTHAASGSGRMLVLATGGETRFGRLASSIGDDVTTAFERGMTAFGLLLVRFTLVLVALIFALNVALGRPLIDAVLFALALAVGLTPQMLPAIVTISLSQGARAMARRRVIVKRLDAIEDFGAMTVLCTDKTGTMTTGTVTFEAGLRPDGSPGPEAAAAAWQNAALQQGFANPIDDALVAAAGAGSAGLAASAPLPRRLDELPYDFERRRLSVLVEDPEGARLITKGAVASVLAVCERVAASDGDGSGARPLDAAARAAILAAFERHSAGGDRVLAVATRTLPEASTVVPADESGLTFLGLLLFRDPPRPEAAATIGELARVGVSVRMITGDNHLVARQVANAVGLTTPGILTGSQIASMDAAALATAVPAAGIFAEVDPGQKERIIAALRASGEVVGYLGDGINDAPALHAADVGISVDSAVDVAKQSAAIVLLDKDLRVLLDGVLVGRRTFSNTMKYVFTTISANFGNMLSLALVSGVLPFLPLTATQILLVNFLSDIPATTIATDRVDPEQLERPLRWELGRLRGFMVRFGSLSSVFDLATFGLLWFGFAAGPELFRSGWFVESIATEITVLLVLRTARPFFRSRPGGLLVASTALVGLVTLLVVEGPLSTPLGLQPLPLPMLGTLLLVTAAYVVATEVMKGRFYRREATARGA